MSRQMMILPSGYLKTSQKCVKDDRDEAPASDDKLFHPGANDCLPWYKHDGSIVSYPGTMEHYLQSGYYRT
jgi:hypothetical protein